MTDRDCRRSIFRWILAGSLCLPAIGLAADADNSPPDAPTLGHKALTPQEALKIRILEAESGMRDNLTKAQSQTLSGPALDDREKAEQAVDRMTFGARPGEVDAIVNNGGWEAWAKMQLNPDSIDDSACDQQVARLFPWTQQNIDKLATNYADDREEVRELDAGIVNSVFYRAVYSKREFKEMMVDFWRNHFCIDMPKGDKKSRDWTAADYEEHVIRKYAFGKFKDMLFASAQHPAMLEYLDQQLSKRGEWNENYAREVMELHTLGADRGYGDRDVQELAKTLTGWRYNKQFHFEFDAQIHQPGPKYWLGMVLPEGYQGGVEALQTLASAPNTADFISRKLCRYLVNDNPPEALVHRIAGVFSDSDGDLSKVYAAIIFSPEFMSRTNFRAKFKTPFQFCVSSLRATDAHVSDFRRTAEVVAQMGEPVYECPDPTGYRDVAESWMDSGVLTKRWDYAWDLVRGNIGGAKIPTTFFDKYQSFKAEQLEAQLIEDMIGSDIGDREIKALEAAAKENDSQRMVSILLGSPSFQQR